MKIALILTPAWSIDSPSFGICTISNILKREGHEVDVYDFNILLWHHLKKYFLGKGKRWDRSNPIYWDTDFIDEKWIYSLYFKKIRNKILIPEMKTFLISEIKKVLEKKYDAIGFSLFNKNAAIAKFLIETIRNISSNPKLFIGGPSVTEYIYMNNINKWLPYIDAAVFGEGEYPVIELINSWEKGYIPNDYPGIIMYDKNGKFHCERSDPYDIDKLPVIDFGDDLSLYTKKILSIAYGRGCVGHCAFCNEYDRKISDKSSKNYQFRTASDIVKEITICVKKYGIKEFRLITPSINGHTQHMNQLYDFCNKLIDAKLDISWIANARFTSDLNLDCLKLLKKSGCYCLEFGLESASERLLKIMGRPSNIENCELIVQSAAKLGILPRVNLIVGFPNENEVDFKETCSFLERNAKFIDLTSVNLCYLSWGSKICSDPSKYGIYVKQGHVMSKKWISIGHSFDFFIYWLTTDRSNTYKIRFARYKHIVKLLEKNKIKWNSRFKK